MLEHALMSLPERRWWFGDVVFTEPGSTSIRHYFQIRIFSFVSCFKKGKLRKGCCVHPRYQTGRASQEFS